MTRIAMLDGEAFDDFDSVQRGLGYGDGLFETMRVGDGRVALWAGHVARLAMGCARLGMDAPDAALLAAERDRLIAAQPEAVLKLLVWRNAKASGYDPAGARGVHRGWTTMAPPPADCAPLRVRWCDLHVARQPRLAGLKTLNRLEQVLARAEWSDPQWDEGLMLDDAGYLVGATAGNVFAVIDDVLVTPALDHCGIAGVFREWMLQSNEDIRIRAILRADIERATEVFVTNAVRGIRPVAAIAGRPMAVGSVTRAWLARARRAGVMTPADSIQ